MKPPDLFVVLNPAAPRYPAEEARKALEAACRDRGLRPEFVETPRSEDAREFVIREVGRALREGCARIVAVGGDGTVGMVAERMARNADRNPDAALGIIPAGTANVLARELGLPTDLEEAVATVVDGGRSMALDTIEIAGRHVLTQVGIGPDALMIRDTAHALHRKLGRIAYMVAFVRRAIRHRPERFAIELDGTLMRARAWQLLVANVGSVGTPPFTWGPGIDPTDGTLDLCVYDVRTARETVRLVWRVLTGRHRRDAQTKFFRIRDRLTIRSERPLLVQGDGEIIGRTPVTLRPVPAALRVLVARPVPEGEPEDEIPRGVGARSSAEAAPVSESPQDLSVAEDVKRMVAARSRTWVLQGVLRHPGTAIEALDATLFLHANRMLLGRGLDATLWATSRIMHYGEGWAVVALMLLLADPAAGIRATLEAMAVLWMTMLTVNYPLKRAFRRRRPFIAFVKARVLGAKPRDFSLPSGHSAAAFAGALLFGAHAPAWSPLFYAVALLMGFSRVYFGVHYPSDVVVGALAGTILAIAYRALIHLLLPGPA